MDESRGYLTVRLGVHPAFRQKKNGPSEKDLAYRARIEEALVAGPLSLTELSRAMGYKSISKRLTSTVDSMAEEGVVAKVATGGMRSKIALVVR